MTTPEEREYLAAIAAAIGVGSADYHVLLCVDATKPKCVAAKTSLEVWAHLKRRIPELGLDAKVLRTKADCLRICTSGPICVVYPDGVWYHSVTPDVMDRILTEHLIDGHVVEEHRITTAPLDP